MTRANPDTVTFPSLDTLRARGTMKWTRYPSDVLPMWVAESDFDTAPEIMRAVRNAVEREYFGYAGDGQPVEEALAGFCERRFNWSIHPDWVRVVPDVVKGVAVAVDELTPAGSTVVIPTPSYYPFFDVPRATHRPSAFVAMVQRDGEWAVDLDALEQAFAATSNPHGVGSLILCSPYNPLGRVFRREELEGIVDLAARYNVRIISDEIHSPVVYDGQTHIPTASVNDTAAEVTVTVTATSKGWNTAGLHCAQMIFTNDRDRQIMADVHPLRTGQASTLGLVAASAAYSQAEGWLEGELNYLSGNLDLLEQRLPEILPGAQFIRPQATFLLWLDLTRVPGLEHNPAATLLRHAKVALSEGTTFGEAGAGHVRWNIASSRDVLSEALDRIADVAPSIMLR